MTNDNYIDTIELETTITDSPHLDDTPCILDFDTARTIRGTVTGLYTSTLVIITSRHNSRQDNNNDNGTITINSTNIQSNNMFTIKEITPGAPHALYPGKPYGPSRVFPYRASPTTTMTCTSPNTLATSLFPHHHDTRRF